MSTTATGQSIELENVQPTHNNQLSPTHQPTNHSVSRDPVDRSPNYTPPLKPVDYPTENPSKLSSQSTTQQAIQPTNQAYTKPANQSKWLWLYYVWVNPWIRWLSIIAVLYVYALSSGKVDHTISNMTRLNVALRTHIVSLKNHINVSNHSTFNFTLLIRVSM